jgi:tetratricopeptide (TPR) repeat protein
MKWPRWLVGTVCVAAAIWLLWNGVELYGGGTESGFTWLLRRDAALLRSEENPSWWDGLTLSWRRYRLERAYRVFIERHPDHGRARVVYGNYLADQGREAAAVEQWQQALALDPKLALAWNNLGDYYAHSGRVMQGLEYFEKAIELEPQQATYRFNWASVCSLYRRDVRAAFGWDTQEIMSRCLAEMRQARQLAPRDHAIARAYAEMFDCLADPDWSAAYDAWCYCAQVWPESLERELIYGRVARAALRLRHFDDAQRWLERMTRPEAASMRQALERKRAALLAGEPDRRLPIMRAQND